MKERIAAGIDRIDSVGGRLVARFWGALLLLGIAVSAPPALIGSISAGSWVSVGVVGALTLGGLSLVKYLFSSKRRLTDME